MLFVVRSVEQRERDINGNEIERKRDREWMLFIYFIFSWINVGEKLRYFIQHKVVVFLSFSSALFKRCTCNFTGACLRHSLARFKASSLSRNP
jgi:hypothetical protein